MLQGTFATLALSELFDLIAQSGKTGELWLDAGPATAVVYVAEGRCCAALSSETPKAITDGPTLLRRLVDLCFAAARVENASFRFGNGKPPWRCLETVDLQVANEQLAALVEEWSSIQAAIPSLECRVRLSEELGVEELVIDPERWRLLAAIDGRRSVHDLVRTTNRPLLEVCHELVWLVDADACKILPPLEAVAGPRSTGGKANRVVVAAR